MTEPATDADTHTDTHTDTDTASFELPQQAAVHDAAEEAPTEVLTAVPWTTFEADEDDGEAEAEAEDGGVGVDAGCAVSTVPVDGWYRHTGTRPRAVRTRTGMARFTTVVPSLSPRG